MLEGGWLPFKTAFELQSEFKEERKFFLSLNFIRRVEVARSISSKEKELVNSPEKLVVKLNSSIKSPMLDFFLNTSEKEFMEKVRGSIFKDHVKAIESVADKDAQVDQPTPKNSRRFRITSDLCSVVSGFKLFLQMEAAHMVSSPTEGFFNIDAKPFKPTGGIKDQMNVITGPLSLKSLASSSSQKEQAPQDPALKELEDKRQISQMYQYYNYLIFEKNKESFNEINPDLRKMTYKYDNEVKNGYMTVQAYPEVIKAAMGLHEKQKPASKHDEKALIAASSDGAKKRQATEAAVVKTKKLRAENFQAAIDKLRACDKLVSPDQLNLCPVENMKFLQEITNSMPRLTLEVFAQNQENVAPKK